MTEPRAALPRDFIYDPETGDLIWARNGKIAGHQRKDCYIVIRWRYKLYLAHHLVWAYHTGSWPENILDHIDRDPSNNRFENLREVTHSQNHVNTYAPINNTSGVKGVDWHKRTGKWRARVAKQHLGLFSTKEAAIAAVKQATEDYLKG